MLMMEPPPFLSIAGTKARSTRCIDLTLTSNERSQSASEHSRMLPWCTQPAKLQSTFGVPNSLSTFSASALTASVLVTSRAKVFALSRPASFAASRSVAITVAPSAMKASAIARPMPCPAAVKNTSLPCKRTAIVTPFYLVIVARHEFLRDALEFNRRLEHHAVGQLIDHAALDFLPRRLARGIFVAAALLQGRLAAGDLGLRHQNVRGALVEVDAHAVVGLEQRQPAADGGFRRGGEDRRRAGRSRLPPVADAGQRGDASFDEGGRRLHVHHLAGAGIADRPDAADKQQRIFVDLEFRIIDTVVIVLRSVEHHGAALEGVVILAIGEEALAEFIRYDAGLHDGGIEQVAFEHLETGFLFHRPFVGADDVGILDVGAFDILAHGLAVDRHRVGVDAAGLAEFVHHRRQAAGAVVFLAELFSRRLHVEQQRHVIADSFPILDRELHADAMT